MDLPRVYVDFQNLDDDNRLRLTCAGTRRDLERQGIELRQGLVLTLYTDDANDRGEPDELVSDGVVQYNEADQCWVAAIDWQAIRHASQVSTCAKQGGVSADDVAAIREALTDHTNGDRGVPFEEFDKDFRARHNLPDHP